MNKVYRSVWNPSLGTWVAAPETARAKHKGSSRIACAVLLGSALLTGNQAMAACDTSTVGVVLCDGAAQTETLIAPVTGLDYTIRNDAVLTISDLGNISGNTHTVTDGQINITTRGAITGGIFNLSNSASSASPFSNLTFNPAGSSFSSQSTSGPVDADGAILGGTFYISQWGHINVATIGSIAGGSFHFSNNASLNASWYAVGDATFTFDDDSQATLSYGAIEDSTLTFNGNSTLVLDNGGLRNSVVTLNGNSKITFSDYSYVGLGDSQIIFGSATAEIDLEGTRLDLGLLTSEDVGYGRLYSSAQHGTGQIPPEVNISGDDADPSATYNFSVLLDTPTNGYAIQLNFNGNVNWALQGHSTNTATLTFNADVGEQLNVSSEGFQHALYVGPNALLTGLGSYFNLTASGNNSNQYTPGVISPGIGTISTSQFGLWYGGTYEVTVSDAAGSGNSSRIETDTMTLLDDARLHVVAQSGAWDTQREYEIIRVNTGFTLDPQVPRYVTEFDSANVSANFAYLTPTVTTVLDDETDPDGPASIMLTLLRNGPGGEPGTPGNPNNPSNPSGPQTFASLANTPNQRGVANAVDSLPNSHPVFNHVLTLPVGAPAPTFDSLSGEAHASVLSGLPNLSSHLYRLPLANLRNSLNAGLNPTAMTAQVGGSLGSTGIPAYGDKPAWVEMVGNWQKIDGNSNAGRLEQNSRGVFVGYDNEVSNGWYLGGALGYTKADADVSQRHSDAGLNSYSATLYGGKAFALDTERQLNLLAGISYTQHDIETDRHVPGMGQKLKANYDAHSSQVFAELGYLIGKPDGRNVEPFAGLTVSHLSVDSFKEKGGSAALRGSSERDTQTVSTLGVRAQSPYEFGNFGAALRGSLAWQHSFDSTQFERSMAFVDGGQAFSVQGVALKRDTAVLGVGTLLNLSVNSSISLDYEGRFASGLREHTAQLKAQWNF